MYDENFDPTKFVGREIERKTFENLLKFDKARDHLPVLCFYGVGGAGKSWLRGHFAHAVSQKNPQQIRCLPYSLVHYDSDQIQDDYPKLLYQIASDFKNCPEFLTAYSIYLERRNLPLPPLCPTFEPRTLKWLIPMLSTALMPPPLGCCNCDTFGG